MDKKELIKLYLQNVDKMFGYANMDAYIDERLKKYMKYLSKWITTIVVEWFWKNWFTDYVFNSR